MGTLSHQRKLLQRSRQFAFGRGSDGKDEFLRDRVCLHDDGDHATPLFDNRTHHGDRYQIGDFDPGRPGLETYAISRTISSDRHGTL